MDVYRRAHLHQTGELVMASDVQRRSVTGRVRWVAVLLFALSLLPVACQPVADTRSPTAPTPVAEQEVAELNETEAVLVEQARQSLAAELGVSPESIELVSIEAVDWPDTSLGCPQPDQMYAAMITPGYKITLQSGDTTYFYHTSAQADGALVRCEE